ncbi:hypothetical protein DFH09DRAFT_1076611 [Mycena vulgaris]|nr:hypothetical protein DFH09DRAFT_1076611 [Mycena vulgaris]
MELGAGGSKDITVLEEDTVDEELFDEHMRRQRWGGVDQLNGPLQQWVEREPPIELFEIGSRFGKEERSSCGSNWTSISSAHQRIGCGEGCMVIIGHTESRNLTGGMRFVVERVAICEASPAFWQSLEKDKAQASGIYGMRWWRGSGGYGGHWSQRRFSEYTAYPLFLMVILALDTNAQAFQAIDATPGERRLRDVCRFLQLILKLSLLAHFEEVIEGVGGSLFDLATIIMNHIRHVVPAVDSPTSAATIHNLSGIFNFIAASHHTPDTRLRGYLVDNGIVTTLVTLICALAAGTEPLAPKIMFSAFSTLDLMIIGPGHMGILAIIEALEAGLLLVVLALSKKNDDNLDLKSQHVLRSTLPNNMIDLDAFTQIAESTHIPPDFAAKLTSFRPSEMFIADWAAIQILPATVWDLPDGAPFSKMFTLLQPLLLLEKLPNRRLADGWASPLPGVRASPQLHHW